MSLFQELKRRNVFRVGIAYAVATWILLQLTDVISEILVLPEWAPKLILLILVIGFVPALIFAWAFELTPEGLKKEKDVDRTQSITPKTGRKLDFAIIGMLGLALGYFIWESRFKVSEKGSEPFSQVTTAQIAEAEPEKRALTPEDKSIAVLPFTNRSPNPDDIYFTDGVHDDLLTQLAKIDAFSVISRTSVMEYRDTTKNLKQIGEELGVAHVMEGAVQRAGNQVRISVQLIDANTDEHLWAEVYDRELTTENLFDIQSEIALAIAGALQATLTDKELAKVANVPTDNVEAYELYLQARRFALGETEIGFDTAIDLYEEALKLDPVFKLAWIGLAKAHITNYWQYGGDPVDRENSRAAIEKAHSIDPDFPELYLAEGFYWYWGHLDYEQAISNLQLAVAQMPGNAEAHMWLAWVSRRNGQWTKAVASMQESLRLDPRVVIHRIELAITLAMLDRHEEALAAANKAIKLNPDSYWSRSTLGDQLIRMHGDVDRAATLMVGAQHTGDVAFIQQFINIYTMARKYEDVLDAIGKLRPEMEIARSAIGLREQLTAWILFLTDRRDEARKQARAALERLQALRESIPYDYRYSVAKARMYAILGDLDQVREMVGESLATKPVDAVQDSVILYALAQSLAGAGLGRECAELLDLKLSNPSNFTVTWIELDPAFDSVRDDPAFVAMLEKHR